MATSKEFKVAAQRLLKKINFLEKEAQARNERFERLVTEEEVINKISRKTSNSPYFYAQSWGGVLPGGSFTYRAWAHNPDPQNYSQYWLFGLLFFGPANFISSYETGLTTIDYRFPTYMQGLSLPSDEDGTLTFQVRIPSDTVPGTYLGNCFLVRRGSFDPGGYYDRTGFDLTVNAAS